MHASSNIERTWALLCRVSMVPASQCGGNMGLMQGEYGTSITIWGGKKSAYKSKLSSCPPTHRLNMTGPSQVISNPQAQVLEAFYLLLGTTVD